MIVADTSALITLAVADVLELVRSEFDVHTTTVVVSELEETAEYDDAHGAAAEACLDDVDEFHVHEVAETDVTSARVDAGEASCLALARTSETAFLLTDDLQALPELRALTEARVAISPVVMRALIERGALEPGEARQRLESVAETRSWLGAPIYWRARSLFSDRKTG